VALAGALLLVFTIFVRPQEFIPGLASVGLLNIAVGVAVLGIVIEGATGKLKSWWSPQIPYLLAFLGWCVVCTLVKVGVDPVLDMKTSLGFVTIFMLVVMYAGRTFTSFRGLAVLLVAIAMGLSAICIHQGRGEFECILLDLDEDGNVAHDESQGEPDGRTCEDHKQCEKDGVPGREYACEKPGLFKTFTVGHGRVRWRGTFADPNELSLAVGAAMSFCFALHASMRQRWRHLLLGGVLATVMYCVVLTGSRGGVLVLLAILGVYFVRKYGAKGLVLGGFAGLPLLLAGGRSGEDAEASSLERLGALYDGVDFFRQSPIFGLGQGQFVENYFITAHNSYLLSAAELGFPGMLIWTSLVYVSIKIPWSVAFRPTWGMDPRLPAYGLALLTSFCGILIGIFFLSFCYHAMLFVYFGMAGALFGVAKQSSPYFDVKVSPKELGLLAAFDAVLMAVLFVYTRIKGGA
jgi:O-antigen ligase